MDDYISRQEAIKTLLELTTFKTKRELVERIESSIADENGWLGGVAECMDEIEDLPSADVQPHKLTEVDLTELRHRFGKEVERVVRDMISGREERWLK